jgi:crotonobetainyl-CoA:carnitine CoA-transferase CaiB-like acyl-CoA transferase
VRNRADLLAIVEPIVRARPVAFWVEQLEAAGVPCGPINNIAQALADPQVAARALRIDLPHPLAGTVPLVANPIKFSATPPTYERAPPTLGQHTVEVLRECGLDAAEIERLRSLGAV